MQVLSFLVPQQPFSGLLLLSFQHKGLLTQLTIHNRRQIDHSLVELLKRVQCRSCCRSCESLVVLVISR